MTICDPAIAPVNDATDTGPQGLSSAEAKCRLERFGANTIVRTRGRSRLRKFLAGFTHFFALILWSGAAIAFFAEYKSPGSGMSLVGAAMIGVIVVNGVFSFWQENKAEEAVLALQRLIPTDVKVTRDGILLQLPASSVVPGDLLALEEGDDVPADCRIVEAHRLQVNNATLTGESSPQYRDSSEASGEDILHARNIVLAGTSIYAGRAKAIVLATGMHTEFGKIAHLTQSTQETMSPLQKEIARLSQVIAMIAVSVGVSFFVIGQFIGISFWMNIVFALGIIVALVPEGLLPEVTLALASCSQRMAKRNALVRNLPSVETLGCASVICTDKTGTLTVNKMSVSELYLQEGSVRAGGDAPETAAYKALVSVALNCENTRPSMKDGKQVFLGDAMEVALSEFAQGQRVQLDALERADEIPFDTDRKRTTTIHSLPGQSGQRILSKGALEELLPLCNYVYCQNKIEPMSEVHRTAFLRALELMTNRGLRVIALCERTLNEPVPIDRVEEDFVLIGLAGLEDPPRVNVLEAVGKCRKAGIKVIMITGDHPNTALAVARQVGIVNEETIPCVVTGPTLRTMTDVELASTLERHEVIFARTSAEQKMRIVVALQQAGHVVAVTGDGVNDAPALKAADIGIAMGLTGTDVARQAADIVLADDNFASIVNAVEEGRAVFSNIKKFLTYVLSSNIAELIPCLAFFLFRLPLPLTVIQVLSIDLCADLLPALALGIEKPESEVMNDPPRSNKRGLFDFKLFARAYLYLGLMVSAASMLAYFMVLNAFHWHPGFTYALADPRLKTAQTACLIGIMCMQIANSAICRSEKRSIFSLGLFSNRLMNFAISFYVCVILLIVYNPLLQALLGTAPLSLSFWVILLGCMCLMVLVEEVRKYTSRRVSVDR